jgi:hypothetical protein
MKRIRFALVASLLAGAAILGACGDDDGGDEGTQNGANTPASETAEATEATNGQTPDAVPTSPGEAPPTVAPPTLAPGQFAVVTLDTNPDTPAVEHDEVAGTVGQTFVVAININNPPQPYQGYEFGLTWDEAILSFVSEEPLNPAEMDVCPDTVILDFMFGIYGGCLRVSGTSSFSGPVTLLTFRCEAVGNPGLRNLTLDEARSLGTALQANAQQFATEIDAGVTVRCS